MQGIIIINPFGHPTEGVHQAERMKEEFDKLGVKVSIVSDGYLRYFLDGEDIKTEFNDIDFAVYFDKDKYLSRALENAGIRVFNKSTAIKDCDDKGETYLALVKSGVKMPKTIFAPLCYKSEFKTDESANMLIGAKLGFPLIVKESFGSMGKGIHVANDQDELNALIEKVKTRPHLYQEYLAKKKGTDVRLIVVGGKVIASMERSNPNDFRSNLATGGKGTKINPSKAFIETAEKCAKTLGLDYCGVDLLYGNDDEPVVCEVNSNAFFTGIESVTKVNVAGEYAKHVIKCFN